MTDTFPESEYLKDQISEKLNENFNSARTVRKKQARLGFPVDVGLGSGQPGGNRRMCLPLNAAEGILSALLGLNLKVEGTGGRGATGKVDKRDFIEADVHGGLVHIDEAPLQWIQES